MNLIEVWFSLNERHADPRAVFTSGMGVIVKISAYIEGWNDRSHPFLWTKTADEILKKANRMKTSNARH